MVLEVEEAFIEVDSVEDDGEIMKKDWDADIDWGARLSVRKIRRMQMEDAITPPSVVI